MPRSKRDAQEDEKREIAEKLRRLREEFYARNPVPPARREIARGRDPRGG